MRFIRIMMKLILFIALGSIAYVESRRNVCTTPGVVAVETKIQAARRITTLEDLQAEIGLQSPFSLRVERTRPIRDGLHRQRLRILYDGLPVRVFTLAATTDESGFYNGAVSGFYPAIDSSLDTSASRRQREVREALADYVNSLRTRVDLPDIKGSDIDNFQARREIHIHRDTGAAEVVYFASGLLQKPNYIRNPRAIMKASTLEVIEGSLLPRFYHGVSKRSVGDGCPSVRGGNARFTGLVYGPGSNEVCLDALVKGGNCLFSNDNVVIKSADNTFDRSQAEVVQFPCDEGPNDAINGANSPSADAYYYSDQFFKLQRDWGKTDISQSGSQVVVYTHVGMMYDNSFFDGYTISLGDGSDDRLYPLAVPEIIGHEFGHAWTRSFGNLQFADESLAIDESFSDICGKALTAYLSGTGQVDDWAFAKEIVKDSNLALRYFDQPTRDGFTIDNVKDFDDQLETPFQGVGIMNNLFYCIVNKGLSVQSAFEAFVHGNSIYWNEETGFNEGACGVYRAFGDLGLDTSTFSGCAKNVGIDLGCCSLVGTKN